MALRIAAAILTILSLAGGCTSVELGDPIVQIRSFGVIYGVITGPDGSPVPGARVQMRENIRDAAVASPTGRYRLSVETHVLLPGPQTALFIIVAPPGSAVRDTTERHARVTLYLAEPVADSNAVALVADQRR